MLQKFVTNILMGFKILCRVGELDFVFFQNYPMYVAPTMSLRGPAPQALRRARSASCDGTGRTGRTDGRSTKVPFNFLETFWAFKTCIYIYT